MATVTLFRCGIIVSLRVNGCWSNIAVLFAGQRIKGLACWIEFYVFGWVNKGGVPQTNKEDGRSVAGWNWKGLRKKFAAPNNISFYRHLRQSKASVLVESSSSYRCHSKSHKKKSSVRSLSVIRGFILPTAVCYLSSVYVWQSVISFFLSCLVTGLSVFK